MNAFINFCDQITELGESRDCICVLIIHLLILKGHFVDLECSYLLCIKILCAILYWVFLFVSFCDLD